MFTLHVNSKYGRRGNWIINLSVLLWNSNIIIAEDCQVNNGTSGKLPPSWPCQWNMGVIPFVFDFFAFSPKRLISVVNKAHAYIEERSCLKFKEMNPITAAQENNFTYLFYSYSEVLESCCVQYFTKSVGRRLVLITPTCFLQLDVAHTTLHALGLEHPKAEPFSDIKARAVMFPYQCSNVQEKLVMLEENATI